MIYPSVDELTGDKYNRYILCIAIAKGARMIAEEKKAVAEAKDERPSKKQSEEIKPVHEAIDRFYDGDIKIVLPQ